MKQIIILLCLTMSLFSYGQNKNALINSIKFYGVDYSQAKVYGADESATQFKIAFREINELFITQTKKFDVGRHLGKKVTEISLEAVNKVNENINPQELMTTNKHYALTKEQVSAAIKALPTQPTEGVGMVFVAGLLDKVSNRGAYQVVFFNTETKEIIEEWITDGKTGGFGLRNFWANTVYKAIKNL